MSRTYKKPVLTGYTKERRYQKRLASKKVRRVKDELPDGCSYKKLYDSYNICEFKIMS